MDPLAHTLVGACLAEAGLKQRTRLAVPALLLGANLPDVDALTMLVNRDCMYGFRRGLTHGVLGVLVGPLFLVGVLWAYDRWLFRRWKPDAIAVRWRTLITLTYLAVLTHPFLDWLNNYGVRLLAPISNEWFYGDALFIIDPWLWLAMASAAVLGWSRSKASLATWLVLGLATTGLVLSADMVPLVAKALWCVGALGIVVMRLSDEFSKRSQAVARAALCFLAGYIALMLLVTALARTKAGEFLKAQGIQSERVMAGPVAARSWRRDVIAVTRDKYYFLQIDFLSNPRASFSDPPIPRTRTPAVEAALRAPGLQGFAEWLRFPAYTSEPTQDGFRVWIRDVRYSRSPSGIGRVRVDLNQQLRPLSVSFDAGR